MVSMAIAENRAAAHATVHSHTELRIDRKTDGVLMVVAQTWLREKEAGRTSGALAGAPDWLRAAEDQGPENNRAEESLGTGLTPLSAHGRKQRGDSGAHQNQVYLLAIESQAGARAEPCRLVESNMADLDDGREFTATYRCESVIPWSERVGLTREARSVLVRCPLLRDLPVATSHYLTWNVLTHESMSGRQRVAGEGSGVLRSEREVLSVLVVAEDRRVTRWASLTALLLVIAGIAWRLRLRK
jgi:hypothetical protein